MFKAGDKVKFKKSSINTGMSDATESDVFEVSESDHAHIQLRDVIHSLTGWWNVNHFEHAEESVMDNTDDAMNNSEEKEINWEIGQEVWCCAYGKGIVESVSFIDDEIHVGFNRFNNSFNYDVDGIVYGGTSRTLFFSEPVVTAELFPPKKPFVASFKEGDTVVAKAKDGTNTTVFYVREEDEECVIANSGWKYPKKNNKFFKLTEEIKFN